MEMTGRSREWWQLGYRNYGEGVPRRASPDGGSGTEAGELWRSGWDKAQQVATEQEAAAPATEPREVALRWAERKMTLIDFATGAPLAGQTQVATYPDEATGETMVTVTFRGVREPR